MSVQPPSPGVEKNIVFPEIEEGRLSNGLRILVVSNSRLPRISVKLFFPVGRISNPDDNLSLASLALELLKSGTQGRSAEEISDLMDQHAIQFKTDVLMEHAYMSMTLLEDHVETALDLLSDLVLNPIFSGKELEKVKIRWRSQIIAQRSQPGFLADESVAKTFYPDHPYSRVSITEKDLKRSTSEKVAQMYREHFAPSRAFLLFTGRVNLEQAVEWAEQFLGIWEGEPVELPDFPEPATVEQRIVNLIHRPHSVQSQILIGSKGLPKDDPDFISLKMANQVLGGGASARLFLNLREDKGYTYGAYSRLKSFCSDGILLAGASVRSEVTVESVEEVLKELQFMREKVAKKEELDRAQSELIGSFIRQMESPISVGELEVERRFNRLPEDYYRNFIPALRQTDLDSVLQMAKRFFDPERTVITVVTDRGKVEDDLGAFGKLRVFDTEGNRI